MTKIIAEIGWNHMGSIEIAKKMIKQAKLNGADFVKTQVFDVKYLSRGPWDNDGRKEIYRKAQINESKYRILNNYSKKIGINFFASIVNRVGADMIKKIDNSIIKIPSANNRNYSLIKYCLKNFKKVIVSLGALKFDEVKFISKLNKNKLILLHCVSTYPCEFEEINLHKIKKIQSIHKYVGFSDHTKDIYASVLSLKYKPIYIEKHFTIDKKLPGRDNKLSILPQDLKRLRKYIDINNILEKSSFLNYHKNEEIIRKIYSKRWLEKS